ncbi:MAG: TonB-dependent receptor [Bacteroides sp.]|nr:TonB-dependent receptor [Bacteroides sp.]
MNIPGSNYRYTKGADRTNISFYGEHNILLSRFSASLGVMANTNTALDHTFRFYPGVDIAYRLADPWKLYASWNMALRMPTYTELYYGDKATRKGNEHLYPEETQSFEAGIKYQKPALQFTAAGFWYKGKNMINWVGLAGDSILYSVNHTRLNNMGAELSGRLDLTRLSGSQTYIGSLYAGYMYIHQTKDTDPGYISEYTLDYLRHKLVVRLDHRIYSHLSASWAFRWQKRMGTYQNKEGIATPYPAFALLDLQLSWHTERYKIYGEINNLLDRNYYDLGNILQPGFWLKAGVSYTFALR